MAARDLMNGKTRWATYEVTLHVDTLVGGIPKDPDTISKWLKARLELGDVETQAIVERTLAEMGLEHIDNPSQLDEVIDKVIEESYQGNGFKVIDGKLVWEGRCLKAALKEASNALYPGVSKWPGHPGTNIRKGLQAYLTERVEVVQTYLPLGREKPDITGEQRIKHVTGPQGKRSAVNVVDVCKDVTVTATLKVLDDCIPEELWLQIWEYVEWGGVGADRSRGDGRCSVEDWKRII